MRASDITIIVDPAQSEDPLFTVEVKTPLGSLDVMAEVRFSGRSIELDGMHIDGNPAQKWGASALRQITQAVMEKLDVDEIRIVGGVRTTGANPGREPRPRRLRRAP